MSNKHFWLTSDFLPVFLVSIAKDLLNKQLRRDIYNDMRTKIGNK